MRAPGIVIGVATGAVLLAGAVAATTASAGSVPGSETGSGPQPGAQAPTADARHDAEADVLDLVNAQRRRYGCGDLGLDGRLTAAARGHADDMAQHGYFAHRSPAGDRAGDRIRDQGYAWSRFAENIARGQDSAAEVVDDWMNSPSHRENILDCRLRELGVGLTVDGARTPYWVQNFATPR
jgi:uncharacterized protein YkwD